MARYLNKQIFFLFFLSLIGKARKSPSHHLVKLKKKNDQVVLSGKTAKI